MNGNVVNLDEFKIKKNHDNFNEMSFVDELRKLFLEYNVASISSKDSFAKLGFNDKGDFCMEHCQIAITTFREKEGE